jgi:hypothetical protein
MDQTVTAVPLPLILDAYAYFALPPGTWQPGKYVFATIFDVCPLVALLLGLK